MIVTAHGGQIWAQRREGGGATIAFTLPLVASESADERVPESAGR
jgi:signal transduction histidine kinase